MRYETVVGLEIHVELLSKSKIFCGCENSFGGEPNTHCCPYCSGVPGALPVLNEKVVDLAVTAGLALNCAITRTSYFDRKQYFYPDLSGAYQITQFEKPICTNGKIEIEDNGKKTIRIHHIHLEEDAGKLIHGSYYSVVDYNRAAMPLIEIVTEPDIRSANEAYKFLERLRETLVYAGVSNCRMEEGSMRSDVNISVRKEGNEEFGVRTEMKNLNSLKSIVRAIEYESKRHIDAISTGKPLMRETRRWDDESGKSYAMRSKEYAMDYRCFPNPDIPTLKLSEEHIDKLKRGLPEPPDIKRQRYINELGLPEYDAGILTQSHDVARFFEAVLLGYPNAKTVSNWIMVDLLKFLKEKDTDIDSMKLTPDMLTSLLKLVDSGEISLSMAKQVFEEAFTTGEAPKDIVEKKGLAQISGEDQILGIVKQVISENPNGVSDYKNGNKKAIAFFVGKVMKATAGKANPKVVNELLKKELDAL